ncbi:MAG: hypothetical protein M1387_05290 [Thaumarchaeota archaeon]|nr:hypothetical protein [Nitrososphaerota archaeon]
MLGRRMKIIDLSTDEEKIKTFFRLVSLGSLALIISTVIYGVLAASIQGINVVGETLVTFEFPPIAVFPLFYSKPVTWLAAALLALYFSTLELNAERISAWPKPLRDFLKFCAFFIGAMAFYEVLFNFTLWSGLIAHDAIIGELNVDVIKNPFPNPKAPWNIVFATKLFTIIMVNSVYSFYYLQRIETKKNQEPRNQRTAQA